MSAPSKAPVKGDVVDPADIEDVRAGRLGDGEAYARLVRRHQQAVAARFRSFTRDANVVEELTHEVFVEAYFALGGFRGDAPFAHWLNRIATRVGYRFWKRRRREPACEPIEGHAAAAGEPAAEPEHSADRLHALLAKLAPRDRIVLTLLYLEDRPIGEAAELIGWSQTMVKVQAFRARRRLRTLLEAEDREEHA